MSLVYYFFGDSVKLTRDKKTKCHLVQLSICIVDELLISGTVILYSAISSLHYLNCVA